MTVPYIATNYASNPNAPVGKWVCAPTSAIAPSTTVPTENTEAPDYCGQCVSYVKHVCPSLPQTSQWSKGAKVKDASGIVAGTIIATFNASGGYLGHVAVYVSKDATGITVYDQYLSGNPAKAIGSRVIRYDGTGNNDGDNYFIVV